MRESTHVFLRGTFYRWMQLWSERCAQLEDAPRVFGVGDLHIENFGTWRDENNRLVWGVNDVDETCRIPYTLDLVRLATSALLAIREGHLAITGRSACDAILDGYGSSIDAGGKAFVIEKKHEWLRHAALTRASDPERTRHFWEKLAACPPAKGRLPRNKLRALMPAQHRHCTFRYRVAGVGSLGRQRFVALGDGPDGQPAACEAKALLPSAATWARREERPRIYIDRLLDDAVRVLDPCFVVRGHWILRRLAPDCARIELGDLPAERDEARLLHAMGWETANIHLGSKRRKIARHLALMDHRWLEHWAEEMAHATTEDFRAWVAQGQSGSVGL
jgi:uncharacterized protein (DUF2252 family)